MFCDYFAIVYLQLELPPYSLRQFELPIELSSSEIFHLLVNVHVVYIAAVAPLSDNLYMVTRGRSLPAGLARLHKESGGL